MELTLSREQYQMRKNIPSAKSLTPIQPELTLNDGRSDISINSLMKQVSLGKQRSPKTNCQVQQKDRLISHLRCQLTLLTQRFKILAQESQVASMQSQNYRSRISTLEQQLQHHKSKSERLEFASKMQALYKEQADTGKIMTDYEVRIESLQVEMRRLEVSKEAENAELRQRLINKEGLEADRKSLIERLRCIEDQYQTKILTLQNQNGGLRVKLADLSVDIDQKSINVRNQSFKRNLDLQQANLQIDRLRQQLRMADLRASDLQQQAESSMRSSRSRDITTSQIRELQQAEIIKLRGINEELVGRIEKLATELEEARLQLIKERSFIRKSEQEDLHVECRKRMETIVVEMRAEHQQKVREIRRVQNEKETTEEEKLKILCEEFANQRRQLLDKLAKASQESKQEKEQNSVVLDDLQKKLEECQQNSKGLKEELRRVQDKFDITEGELQQQALILTSEKGSFALERSKMQRQLQQYKTNVQRIQQNVDQLSAAAEVEKMSILSDLKKSRQAYKALDTELNARTASLQALNNENSELKVQYTRIESQFTTIQTKLQCQSSNHTQQLQLIQQSHLQQLSNLSQQLQTLRTRFQDCQQQSQLKDLQMAQLSRKLQSTKQQCLQSSLRWKEDNARKLRQLTQTTQMQQSQISSLMSRLASKESHSESVLNEIKREYEERVRRVLEEREEREREIEGELRKYTEVCSELRLSLSDSQLFVEQRTSETTKLKDANSILDHELNASKLHQADLKKQTVEKEGEINRLKTELEKIEVALKNTEAEKVKQKNEHQNREISWKRQKESFTLRISDLEKFLVQQTTVSQDLRSKVESKSKQFEKFTSEHLLLVEEHHQLTLSYQSLVTTQQELLKKVQQSNSQAINKYTQLTEQLNKKLSEQQSTFSEVRKKLLKELSEKNSIIASVSDQFKNTKEQCSELNLTLTKIKVELNCALTDKTRLKSQNQELEKMLEQLSQELKSIKAQMQKFQGSSLEKSGKWNEQKKKLIQQLAEVQAKAQMEANLRLSESKKHSMKLQQMSSKLQTSLQEKHKQHLQKTEQLYRSTEQDRQSLLTELNNMKQTYRRRQAQHFAELAILRQCHSQQLCKNADTISGLQIQMTHIQRDHTVLKQQYESQMSKYWRLKQRYAELRKNLMAVQYIEDQDILSPIELSVDREQMLLRKRKLLSSSYGQSKDSAINQSMQNSLQNSKVISSKQIQQSQISEEQISEVGHYSFKLHPIVCSINDSNTSSQIKDSTHKMLESIEETEAKAEKVSE